MEIIVAVDLNWGIGRGGNLLQPISEDLKRFKQLTLGKTVVYGRKTLDSFPGGRPLPKRPNIILSRHLEEADDRIVVRSYEELAEKIAGIEDVKLIGGASVYRDLLPYCSSAEVTVIDHAFSDVEHYFPNLDELDNWQLHSQSEPMTDEKSGLNFTYRRYINTAVIPFGTTHEA